MDKARKNSRAGKKPDQNKCTIYEVQLTICAGHPNQNRTSKIVHRIYYCPFLNVNLVSLIRKSKVPNRRTVKRGGGKGCSGLWTGDGFGEWGGMSDQLT